MDLSLSDIQVDTREALGRFLQSEVTTSAVRAAEPVGFSPALWSKFCSLGFASMTSPSRAGSDAALFLDVALVCEQLGSHLTPVPFIDTIVAARVLERLDSDLAGEFLDEPGIATVALSPVVDGVARSLPAGAVAELAITLEEDRLYARRPGQIVAGQDVLGSVPMADWHIEGPDHSIRERLLVQGSQASDEHRRTVTEWRILTAAWLVGLAEGALDLAVDYVTGRRQFGVPIGSFQTVSHRLADCSTALEGARLLCREAAWAIDSTPDEADLLGSMAMVFAAETAQHIASESLHFHGGYGYTLEYDIQLFYTRAKAWSVVAGPLRHLYLTIADGLVNRVPSELAWISR